MKKLMMKYLMVSCKEATLLMDQKEENKLYLIKRLKLSVHISMCSFCKKFEEQTAKIAAECRHIHAEADLTPGAKERMNKALSN